MTRPGEPSILLADLLDRLGEEAGNLALEMARAETAVQSVLQDLRGLPVGIGSDLQQIDLVRQSLEDFSRLLWIAAAAVPAERRVAIAGVCSGANLTGLVGRLTAGHQSRPVAAEQDEVTFF